jgi:uncharacterized protein YgbK (DUF1537 family)
MAANLIILADDLTGAADSAARCVNAGLPAVIVLTPTSVDAEPTKQNRALALASDSRHLQPEAAVQRVQGLAESLTEVTAGAIWCKKIDSTLRGNIGAEIDALLDSLPRYERAIIAPAFPAQGRGLQDGWLVHPGSRPRSRHLPTLLRSQSRRSVGTISLAETQNLKRLHAAMDRAWNVGERLLAVDARTDADLARIVAAAQDWPDALLCGSAGIVGALAARLAPPEAPPADVRVTAQRILIVVGSGSDMAHRQIETLASAPWASVHMLTPAGDLDPPLTQPDLAADERRAWLLHLPEPAPETPLDGPTARAIAAHLTDAATGLIARIRPQALILVGGDTAMGVLARLNATRLEVVTELLPGMPLTRPVYGELDAGNGVNWAVMKAGNHGEARTLKILVERVWGERRDFVG